MTVDCNISDLFFNTQLQLDASGEYSEIENEAADFLNCLTQLGVPTPTVDELVADFRDRL